MALLTTLPTEVIDLIIGFICWPEDGWEGHTTWEVGRLDLKLAPYAGISRSWQHAIERLTFEEVHIQSSELDDFARIMSPRRSQVPYHRNNRRAYLKELHFFITFPEEGGRRIENYWAFESEEEQQATSESFTRMMKALFQMLRLWYDDHDDHDAAHLPPTFRLTLESCHGSKNFTIFKDHNRVDVENHTYIELPAQRGLLERRYRHSMLRLLGDPNLDGLVDVPQVTFFDSYVGSGAREFEPKSLARLASKCPNSEDIAFWLSDNEKKCVARRQSVRYEFAQSLSLISHRFLTNIRIKFANDPIQNHYRKPSSALQPFALGIDHLSLALHRLSLSPNLKHVSLGVTTISPCVFWPGKDREGGANAEEPPFWPRLETYQVRSGIVAADGDWLYRPADDHDPSRDWDRVLNPVDDPEDWKWKEFLPHKPDPQDYFDGELSNPYMYDVCEQYMFSEDYPVGDLPGRRFRTLPSPAKLNPWFEAMALAGTRMPSMQLFEVSICPPQDGSRVDVAFSTKRGRKEFEWEDQSKTYRPEESTIELWKHARGDLEGELDVSINEEESASDGDEEMDDTEQSDEGDDSEGEEYEDDDDYNDDSDENRAGADDGNPDSNDGENNDNDGDASHGEI